MSTTNNTTDDETDSTTYDEESMTDQSEHDTRISEIINSINEDTFETWHREREYAENIKNGKPYYNSPGYISPDEKHSPSKLLQCHRKVFYDNQNTPAESEMPTGIFFFGNKFEEEIALPFLEDTANSLHQNNYIRQDMYINYEVDVDGVDLLIKGETDPVITDNEGAPLVVTEIKTTGYIDSKRGPDAEPSKRHKAQLHAYMAGLNQKYDRDIDKGIIVYGERDSLDMVVFEIDFDEDFWNETVLDWASTQTEYRLNDELPPAEPEEPSWECKYCDYRERCGQNDDTDWEDTGINGFVPLVEYPDTEVKDYLDSELENGAKLTPTLAYQHPTLTEEYDVFDWECDYCTNTFNWNQFDWDRDTMNPPVCPDCKDEHGNLPLRGPLPKNQLSN